MAYIVVITLLMAMDIGGAFAIIEGADLLDGLWWAIVTVTTVGYGDMFPITPAGRISAAVLMLLGIGFVALITASVAAHFVEDDEGPDLTTEMARLQRLDTMEALLRETAETQGGRSGNE